MARTPAAPPATGAAQPWSSGQRAGYAAAAIALVAAVVWDWRFGSWLLATLMLGGYGLVVGIKVVAVLAGIARGPQRPAGGVSAISRLPMYSVLVPLYREAEVVGDLVAALARIDYHKDRVEALLLVEEDDRATAEALRPLQLPSWIRVVVVPPGIPKTKPRACNVGLAQARGQLLVVFDAEDRPEPDQLLKAVASFAACPPEVACLQAKLNFFNRSRNLITRWFALEYAAWFDLYLPGLHAIGAPIPLGGTSNHFRTDVLRELGGWDAHNVTEDCDLGIRLERAGWRTRILDSTTWEEAPSRWMPWIRQRSRWMKGYWQTHLVHTRHPLQTLRELGWWKTLLMLLTVGGQVGSLLVNPLCWVIGACWLAHPWRLFDPHHPWTLALVVASAALLMSNLLFILIHALAALQRGFFALIPMVVLLPFYWMMLSVGAWRGVAQFFSAPFLWEKTPHGLDAAAQRAAPPADVRDRPRPEPIPIYGGRGLGRRSMQALVITIATASIAAVALLTPGWMRAYEQIRWAAIDLERSRLVHERVVDACWLGQDAVTMSVALQERAAADRARTIFRALLYIKVLDGEWYQLETSDVHPTAEGAELRASLEDAWQPVGSGRPWGPDCLRRVRAVGVKLFVADDDIQGLRVADVRTSARPEPVVEAPPVPAAPAAPIAPAPPPVIVAASTAASEPPPAATSTPTSPPTTSAPTVAAIASPAAISAPHPASAPPAPSTDEPHVAAAHPAPPTPVEAAPVRAARAGLGADLVSAPDAVERGEMCEIRFRLSRFYENPFDPAEIDVWATFIDAGGRKRRVPAFYTQDYRRERSGDLENLIAQDKPYWAARFTCETEGDWTWSISGTERSGASFTLPGKRLSVQASSRRGFARVDERDHRWFSFQNGEFLYPIALNIRSPADDRDSQFSGLVRPKNAAGSFAMDDFLTKMQAGHITLGRVWMAPWFGGLEWRRDTAGFHGLGAYNLKNAWVIDQVLRSAAERGILIELALNSHGPFTLGYDSQWNENPYNAVNGGPARQPKDVLSDPEAKRLFRNRFRYTAARYGADPALFAWTLWIEVNMVDENAAALTAWHREMSEHLSEMDSGRHPISSEFNNETGTPEVWRLPRIGYTQLAAYSWGKGLVSIFSKRARELEPYGKPAILEEYGGQAYGGDAAWIAHEIHDGLWAGLMLPLAGTPMPWWWNLIFSKGLQRYHHRFADFMAGEDLRGVEWTHGRPAVRHADGLSALARSGPDRAFLWIYRTVVSDIPSDQQYWEQARQKSLNYAQAVGRFDAFKADPGALFPLVEGADIDLHDLKLASGSYRVEFWDTWSDRKCETSTLTVGPDSARLRLPSLTRDLAVKLVLVKP